MFCEDEDCMIKNSSLIGGPNIDSAWIDKAGNFGYRGVGRVPKR